MKTYIVRHIQVFFATLGQIVRSPLNSLTTVLIIAISLLLPSIMYVFLKSAQDLSSNWQGRPQVSIFLNQGLGEDEIAAIFQEIELTPNIAVAELIKPDAALNEFKTLSGLDAELNFLDANPLPSSVVVMPSQSSLSKDELEQLKGQLEKIDGVDQIKHDLAWTNRFNAILSVFNRVALLLGIVIVAGLILIVSNTIRLIILNKREEIEITKLVGGSNSFIRRPFLYYGFIIGILGGITALALLTAFFFGLHQPIDQVAQLYNSDNPIYALSLSDATILIGIAALTGWGSARLSLAKHLHAIRPR